MTSTHSPQQAEITDHYSIFNRDRTIGVSASVGGKVVGFRLHESVRKTNERTLTRQILEVASVASMRGRLALREQMEASASESGYTVPPATYETLSPPVPTAEEYEEFKRQTLRY